MPSAGLLPGSGKYSMLTMLLTVLRAGVIFFLDTRCKTVITASFVLLS